MKVITLKMPSSIINGFATEDDPEALKYIKDLEAVYEALNNGTLHCRFTGGDRKGSIAKLSPEPGAPNEAPVIGHRYSGVWNGRAFTIRNDYLYTICSWAGRKNKVKVSFPHHEAELLLGYEGPTIWEKFDTKAAKEEALKEPDQRDIDGRRCHRLSRTRYPVRIHAVQRAFPAVPPGLGLHGAGCGPRSRHGSKSAVQAHFHARQRTPGLAARCRPAPLLGRSAA